MESFKTISKSKGYRSLKASVVQQCKKEQNCFNTTGCNKKQGKVCFHRYCNKFKWIIDRAKHYSHKTGVPVSKLLDAWEEDRSYWYQNYYQDANQPKIKGDNVLVVENKEELREIFKKGFRCPACGGVSSNPTKCDSGIKHGDKVCDWKSYGLFGTLGKGLYVFPKEVAVATDIFMPITVEEKLITVKP